MSETKRVVVALDLPPRLAHKKTVDSFKAAAKRWDAEMLWLRVPLHDCHPYWQKLMICRNVVDRIGHCHLLQLDTDMLIRDDCPSPFELAGRSQMGMIAGRQGNFTRLGVGTWAHHAHGIWARRFGTKAAPPWAHPNGGFYLYHTDAFVDFFDRITARGPEFNYDKRFGCDESLIINHLWDQCPDRVHYLPGEFNTLLHHNPHLCQHHSMQTYVYHFVGDTKKHLTKTWWRRGKKPAQPIPFGKHAQVIFELLRSADSPMRRGVEVGVFHGNTAANLLALMPDLELYGVDPWTQYPADEEQPHPDHVQQLGGTQTLYWGLSIAMHNLAVNASRWHPIRLPSVKAARCFDDGELDFVFIDAEHSYDAVKADIEAWWPKVRPGGLVMGHDYNPKGFPGVCRAVDEFAKSQKRRVIRSGQWVWTIPVVSPKAERTFKNEPAITTAKSGDVA